MVAEAPVAVVAEAPVAVVAEAPAAKRKEVWQDIFLIQMEVSQKMFKLQNLLEIVAMI